MLRTPRLNPRRNPLVGWEDTSGLVPARALEPKMVLVKPGAEQAYALKFAAVKLPIAVAIRPPGWGYDKKHRRVNEHHARDQALAEALDAVLLVVVMHERKVGEKFYQLSGQVRGSSERSSLFTPFQLLHKLGDSLRTDSGSALFSPRLPGGMHWLREPKDPRLAEAGLMFSRLDSAARDRHQYPDGMSDSETSALEARRLSRGVDTAAGRMGVIGADYMSDLFAKWLLTGRVAYSATDPAPQSEEERTFRTMVADYAPKIFNIFLKYLQETAPSVTDVSGL